jgi:hypothetical protein
MVRRAHFLLILAAFAGVTLWAAAQNSPEELDAQRRRLEALRKDPEVLNRLRANLKSFQLLPEERQKAIVQFDKDLHDFSAKKLERYWSTLERYADWLDGLRASNPEAYQAIKNAPDAQARLALIKERRDLEWIETQPKAVREQWKTMDRKARAEFVVKLRTEEREKHENWLLAKRFWPELNDPKQTMPSRLSDFATVSKDKAKTEVNKVKDYVDHFLLPQLDAPEKALLEQANGHWPDYPRTLVALASKRPSALPPLRTSDFSTFKKLPDSIQKSFGDKKGTKKTLELFKGDNFPSKVVEFAMREKKGGYPFPYEFWACTDAAFLPPMKGFLKDQLMPAVKDHVGDKRKLLDTVGKWPDYPLTIQELSKKYNLQPPWHYLPEPDRWKWNEYRNPKYKSLTADAGKDK